MPASFNREKMRAVVPFLYTLHVVWTVILSMRLTETKYIYIIYIRILVANIYLLRSPIDGGGGLSLTFHESSF
jgi:hypothetical protein